MGGNAINNLQAYDFVKLWIGDGVMTIAVFVW